MSYCVIRFCDNVSCSNLILLIVSYKLRVVLFKNQAETGIESLKIIESLCIIVKDSCQTTHNILAPLSILCP